MMPSLEDLADIAIVDPGPVEVTVRFVVHRGHVACSYQIGSNTYNNTSGATWSQTFHEWLRRRTYAKEQLNGTSRQQLPSRETQRVLQEGTQP